MIEVPVLKDIRAYKTKVVGPLSTRELFCALFAVGGAYAAYFVQTSLLGMEEMNGFVTMLAALPGAAFGWVRPYGLNFEVYLKAVFIDSVLAPTVRPYRPENPYYKILKKSKEEDTDNLENKKKQSKSKKIKRKDLPSEWQSGK